MVNFAAANTKRGQGTAPLLLIDVPVERDFSPTVTQRVRII